MSIDAKATSGNGGRRKGRKRRRGYVTLNRSAWKGTRKAGLSRPARLLLAELIIEANDDTGELRGVTERWMSEAFRFGRTTLRRALAELEAAEVIKVDRAANQYDEDGTVIRVIEFDTLISIDKLAEVDARIEADVVWWIDEVRTTVSNPKERQMVLEIIGRLNGESKR